MKDPKLPPEITAHYEAGAERGRLYRGAGYLELIRTQQIVKYHLPKHVLDVLDIGGGPGIYSKWLAELGHKVHMIDAVSSHVEQARQMARDKSGELFYARLGDARRLEWPARSFDVVLMLGPLYHLTRRQDRIRALKEAHRVLRPKGLLFVAAISRYASLVDGLKYGFLDDPAFQKIVKRDLKDGQHRNPDRAKHYFTTAFSHHPDELAEEVEESGFRLKGTYAIEGPAAILRRDELDAKLRNAADRDLLIRLIMAVETEPSLMGISSHLLAVGTAD